MSKKLSRRQFLKLLGGAGAGLAISGLLGKSIYKAIAQAFNEYLYLPLVTGGGTPSKTGTPTLSPTGTVTPTATDTTVPGPSATATDTTVPGPSATATITRTPGIGPIIADHTIVDRYQYIPQTYIDLIKKMWVDIPGESHSMAYRKGCELLENQDNRFEVNVIEGYGTPEGYTDRHMRISRATWGDVNNPTGWIYNYGEEDWYTSALAIQRTKDHLTYCNTNNLEIAAIGFGWCWDTTGFDAPDSDIDPVYQVRWGGYSNGGPDGNIRWGLDMDDYALTGNHICMDTYLDSVLQYMAHCQSNNFPTKVFFTTSPVDSDWNLGENGYQRNLKHEHIRNFVKASSDRILFDYADILCLSDAGLQNYGTWTDFGGTIRTFPYIHDDNMLDLNGSYSEDGDHIGERGALRLGKALWWMLARMAGWDGR